MFMVKLSVFIILSAISSTCKICQLLLNVSVSSVNDIDDDSVSGDFESSVNGQAKSSVHCDRGSSADGDLLSYVNGQAESSVHCDRGSSVDGDSEKLAKT